MIDFVKKNQAAKTFKEPETIVRHFPEESPAAATAESKLEMDVLKPKLNIGMKCTKTDVQGEEMLIQELSSNLVLDILFGRSSDFYTKAYNEGLIDESFNYDFSLEEGFGFAMVGSDTEEPKKLEALIRETIDGAVASWPVTDDDLNRMRKKGLASSCDH